MLPAKIARSMVDLSESKTVPLLGHPSVLLREAMSFTSQIARQHRLMRLQMRSEKG